MSVLYIAMPIAFVLAGLALWAFVRCARTGQYDDLDTPPLRMLADDDAPSWRAGKAAPRSSMPRGVRR